MTRIAACFVVSTLPVCASAQADRFELGRRLIQFEKAWDKHADVNGRKRVVPHLNQSVRSFFSFSFGSAGEALDRARHALASQDAPPGDTRWAESLFMVPEVRFGDSIQTELSVVIKPFYKTIDAIPKNAKLRVSLSPQHTTEAAIAELPLSIKCPTKMIGAGDRQLRMDAVLDGKAVATHTVGVSFADNLKARLASLRQLVEKIDKASTIEQATLLHLTTMLADLAEKKFPETNLPANRLLTEAEALAVALKNDVPFYDASRSGQFWLRIPSGKFTEPVRILIPDKLDPKKPVPILFALHGAGGSENMFFDTYGAGITARLCKERGWIMVATRANGLFGVGGAPNVPAILEQLQKRYPIDASRVCLVGHSMGAGHVLSIVQETPNRFAGAAVLGGGGVVRKAEVFTKVPLFIGCGKADFALTGARNLAASLKKIEGAKVTYREYDDIEHLLIVREAVPEVFREWDAR